MSLFSEPSLKWFLSSAVELMSMEACSPQPAGSALFPRLDTRSQESVIPDLEEPSPPATCCLASGSHRKLRVGASRSTSWAGRILLPEPGGCGALSLPPSSNRLPSAPFCPLRLLTRCACPAAPGCPVCYTAHAWSCPSSVPASGGAWDTEDIFSS